MKITSFADQCRNASTEALCRSYKSLRRQEDAVRAKLSSIRQELESRGFFPSKEEVTKIWELSRKEPR